MSTKNWRILVMVPQELDEKLKKLRLNEPYKSMSYSALMQYLAKLGLEAQRFEPNRQEGRGLTE